LNGLKTGTVPMQENIKSADPYMFFYLQMNIFLFCNYSASLISTFSKGGRGGIWNPWSYKIPLNPPFLKGET